MATIHLVSGQTLVVKESYESVIQQIENCDEVIATILPIPPVWESSQEILRKVYGLHIKEECKEVERERLCTINPTHIVYVSE